MDVSSPQPCPNTATVRRNPYRRARATPINVPQNYNSSISKLREVPPFPNEEILSAQKLESAPVQLSSTPLGKSESENIKVFLRIRPLLPPSKGSGKAGSVADQNPRLRAKNVWPQNPTKKNIVGQEKNSKKSSRVCVMVNDSHSVTLSTPKDSQESKKIKSETYGGFSHVFSADSSQFDVYGRMVKPMVDDFLRGKSGMLAALGPSGSGKTHTVFGSPREPGMVPLALQHIFKETEPRANQALRSFYISIFEIYSERGKAEKLFDLLPDGCELSMQQSTVKGLQEVLISSVGQAESLIAQAVLKRATAMTNTNSQSSRSQCIINVRQKCEGAVSAASNSAVLTIIDLAGAEREKKTGNQGTRLLESNFINNTLMVFGLCLRSLLEHQKNPKKPLQKHFQNSLLTRYLRDYLEGKKRMTLILTAKSGEEDYLDTSYLLRQASPYMKIKYNEVEPSKIVPNKRQYQASSTMEHAKPSSTLVQAKRMRLISSKESNEEETVKELIISKEECGGQAQSDRSHIIMQNFAKAIWNVLKQYNAKLKVAEMEIQSLRESIGHEKKKYQELETEMNEFKANCTCCRGGKVKADFECQPKLYARESSCVNKTSLDLLTFNLKATESICTEQGCDLAQTNSQEMVFQAENRDVDPDSNQISCAMDHKLKVNASVRGCDDDINASRQSSEKLIMKNCQTGENFLANEHCTRYRIKSKHDQSIDEHINCSTDYIVSPPQSRSTNGDGNCSFLESDQLPSLKQEEKFDAQASSEPRLHHSDHKPTLGSSCILLDAEKPDRKGWVCLSSPGNHNASEDEEESKIPTEFNTSLSLPSHKTLEPSSPEDVSSTKVCDYIGSRHYDINASGLSGDKLILRNCQENEDCIKDIIKSKRDQTNYDYIDRNTDFIASPPQPRSTIGDDNCSTLELDQPRCSEKTFDAQASSEPRLHHLDDKSTLGTFCTPSDAEKSDRKGWACSSKPGKRNALEVELENKILTELNPSSLSSETLEPSSTTKDVSSTKVCDHVGNRHYEKRVNNSHIPQKPKRRLMPSTSMLLRDLSNLDLVDETETSKGRRATRKSAADDLKRTNGSISLIRMLKSNLHL